MSITPPLSHEQALSQVKHMLNTLPTPLLRSWLANFAEEADTPILISLYHHLYTEDHGS